MLTALNPLLVDQSFILIPYHLGFCYILLLFRLTLSILLVLLINLGTIIYFNNILDINASSIQILSIYLITMYLP